MVKGYEKVINARLSYARFLFEEDQKTTLSARLEGLKNVLFQKGLGSTFDKVDRNRSLTAPMRHFKRAVRRKGFDGSGRIFRKVTLNRHGL